MSTLSAELCFSCFLIITEGCEALEGIPTGTSAFAVAAISVTTLAKEELMIIMLLLGELIE